MELTLNITEDSKVELIEDSCEAVQGENNATTLNINWPNTIKGYPIDNYKKNIEFKECKDFGECVKFYDVVEGNTYNLCSTCTQFKKVLIQFTLKNVIDEAEPIVWKTIPFALEFSESINAENTKQVQVALLSLSEILDEWENYIKAHTLRMIYKAGDVPTADAASEGDTIFYLGQNTTSPYELEYGYYYKCNYIDNEYEWTNLCKDKNVEDVANGVREINKNRVIQFWLGLQEELDNTVKLPNTFYIPEDQDAKAEIDEILTEMVNDEKYNTSYIKNQKDAVLKVGTEIISKKVLLYSKDIGQLTASDYSISLSNDVIKVGDKVEIEYVDYNEYISDGSTTIGRIVQSMKTIIPTKRSMLYIQLPNKQFGLTSGKLTLYNLLKGFVIDVENNLITIDFGEASTYSMYAIESGSVTETKSNIKETYLITKIYKIIE